MYISNGLASTGFSSENCSSDSGPWRHSGHLVSTKIPRTHARWYFNCSVARLTHAPLCKRHKLLLETRRILQHINCFRCIYLKAHDLHFLLARLATYAIFVDFTAFSFFRSLSVSVYQYQYIRVRTNTDVVCIYILE